MNASTVTSHGRLPSLQIRNGSYVIRRWLQTGKKKHNKSFHWYGIPGKRPGKQRSKRKSNPLSSFSVKVNAQGRKIPFHRSPEDRGKTSQSIRYSAFAQTEHSWHTRYIREDSKCSNSFRYRRSPTPNMQLLVAYFCYSDLRFSLSHRILGP